MEIKVNDINDKMCEYSKSLSTIKELKAPEKLLNYGISYALKTTQRAF